MKVEEARDDKRDFVGNLAEVLSSMACAAGDSPVTRVLKSSYSTQSDIDTLKSCIKRIGNCRKISKMHMAQMVVREKIEKMDARISQKTAVLMRCYSKKLLLKGFGNR